MTTLYDSVPNYQSWVSHANTSLRQIIPASIFSLGLVTLTFRSGHTAGWKTDHVSIGIAAGGANTTATPTEITFGGGNSGFTLAGPNSTITSDPIEFAFDEGDDLVIITDTSSDPTLVDMAINVWGATFGPSTMWIGSSTAPSWNLAEVTNFGNAHVGEGGFLGYTAGFESITTTLGPPPTGTITIAEAPDTCASYGVAWASLAVERSPFFFAWANETDTEFHSNFERVDEDIFSFGIKHDEGQHPTLDITIINPRVGLLHAGRKLWAWFSWRNPETGHVVPLFFGVLVGVPTDLFQEKVTLKFVARSPNYIDDKQAVAETMKIRPYWDPVFLDNTHRDDPDSILEGWSKLWHIDRTTLVTSASDILEGEDGTVAFGESDGFYDSLSVKLGQPPLTDVRVEVNVQWTQRQERLMTGPSVAVSSYTGDTFMSGWPKSGAGLGGGWKVESSYVVDTYSVALTPTQTYNSSWASQETTHENCDTISMTANSSRPALLSPNPISIEMTGKFVVGWCDPYGDPPDVPPKNTPASYETTGIIIPLWSLACSMQLRYEAKRQFTEALAFDLKANTQGVLTSPTVAQHTELITRNGADVGEPLITYDAWSDFKGKPVGYGTMVYPNNPTTPGGLSYHVCVGGGTCGLVEPDFSDIPGTIANDNGVQWASLGTSPESVIQRMAFGTSYGAGTILFYQQQYFDQNTGQLEDVIEGNPGGFPFGFIGSNYWNEQTQSGPTGYYLILRTGTRTKSEYTDYIYRPVNATSDAAIPLNVNVKVEEFGPVGLYLGMTPPLLGIPIGGNATNVTSRCYFPTARGNWSVEYLLCVARAHLRMRARAVTVGWDCPFELATTLSCRMNASIRDPRLPGATATGKITSYELKGGSDGKFIGHVEIGCAVGYGGHVSSDPGTPEYAAPGYMQPGYQKYDNVIVAPTRESDISYTPPGFSPFDDGLSFPLSLDQVADFSSVGGVRKYGTFSGSLDQQTAAINAAIPATIYLANDVAAGNYIVKYKPNLWGYDLTRFDTATDAVWSFEEMKRLWTAQAIPFAMESNPIAWTMELKNIQNGPFNGSYSVETSMLEVPQGINLEAASSV